MKAGHRQILNLCKPPFPKTVRGIVSRRRSACISSSRKCRFSLVSHSSVLNVSRRTGDLVWALSLNVTWLLALVAGTLIVVLNRAVS